MPRSSGSSSSSSNRYTSSNNSSHRLNNSSRKQVLPHKNVLFISHLNPQQEPYVLAAKLRQLFSSKCTIQSLEVKTTQNGRYKFAFLQLKQTQKIQKIIDQINGTMLNGSKILVERQKSKRSHVSHRNIVCVRNGGNCYRCNKPGHFARECPQEYRQKMGKSIDKEDKSEKRHKKAKQRRRERRKSTYRSRDRQKKKKKIINYQYSSSSSASSPSSSNSDSRSRSGSLQIRQQKNIKRKRHSYSRTSKHLDQIHKIH